MRRRHSPQSNALCPWRRPDSWHQIRSFCLWPLQAVFGPDPRVWRSLRGPAWHGFVLCWAAGRLRHSHIRASCCIFVSKCCILVSKSATYCSLVSAVGLKDMCDSVTSIAPARGCIFLQLEPPEALGLWGEKLPPRRSPSWGMPVRQLRPPSDGGCSRWGSPCRCLGTPEGRVPKTPWRLLCPSPRRTWRITNLAFVILHVLRGEGHRRRQGVLGTLTSGVPKHLHGELPHHGRSWTQGLSEKSLDTDPSHRTSSSPTPSGACISSPARFLNVGPTPGTFRQTTATTTRCSGTWSTKPRWLLHAQRGSTVQMDMTRTICCSTWARKRWSMTSSGYPITVIGFSYGTRVAAAYASQFPGAIQRVAVSGVEAPNPDLLEFAKEAGLNTAQILGFIQSQCAGSTSCRKKSLHEGLVERAGILLWRGLGCGGRGALPQLLARWHVVSEEVWWKLCFNDLPLRLPAYLPGFNGFPANSPTHSLVSENQEQAGAAIPGRYVANRLPDAASCSIYLGAKPLFHGSTCNGEPTTIAIWHLAYHLLSHPSAWHDRTVAGEPGGKVPNAGFGYVCQECRSSLRMAAAADACWLLEPNNGCGVMMSALAWTWRKNSRKTSRTAASWLRLEVVTASGRLSDIDAVHFIRPEALQWRHGWSLREDGLRGWCQVDWGILYGP